MKKLKLLALGILLSSGLAIAGTESVTALAEGGNVATSNYPAWKFAGGWDTTQSYTNEGATVTVPGKDAKGDNAWQYSAVLPADDSRAVTSFDVSDQITIEFTAKMYDATTNTQISTSNADGGGALDIYIVNSSNDTAFAMLRVWVNSGGWTNGDHSYSLYNTPNGSVSWSDKGAGYWVKGNAAGTGNFMLTFDKENIVSSYVGGNDNLVALGNSEFIDTAKSAMAEASGIYLRICGSNGFSASTDVTLCSVNGQSLANDGTNFIDTVAPEFTKSSLAAVATDIPAYQEYEIPAEAKDLFDTVNYSIEIDGNKIDGKKFTPKVGTNNVTLYATDLGGNVTSKSFVFNATYSTDSFVNEWHNLRTDGSICDMLSDSKIATLEDMFVKFDAFDETEKATIRATIDVEDITIGETMDYLRGLMSFKSNDLVVTNESLLSVSNENIATTSLVILLVFGSISLVGYILISRKKKNN